MEMLIKNEEMDKIEVLKSKERQICEFVNRLKTEEYKAILYNGQSPILVEDIRVVDFILDDLTNESTLELNTDILVIHNENEIIELTGYKEMSDHEIVARKYLDGCYVNTLIIKDDEMQLEFREDNFKKAEDYYDKCKNIIDIDIFIGDESDPVWRMNWDAIWVTYKDTRKELWQRM